LINPKQTSLLAAFLDAKAEFAVVGGIAVIAHGYVRATSDIDLFIRPTLENALLVLNALRALDYPVSDLEPSDLLLDYDNIRFGPRENQVDILPSIGEMSFDQVWRNRIEARVGNLLVPFISKADLIQNKLQVGRLRDLADAEELSALNDDPFPRL
jgi:hypothetical protein